MSERGRPCMSDWRSVRRVAGLEVSEKRMLVIEGLQVLVRVDMASRGEVWVVLDRCGDGCVGMSFWAFLVDVRPPGLDVS
jgi:hypothetical protein